MRKTALSLGVVLILAACGGGAADTTTTTSTTVPTTTSTAAPTTTTTTEPTTTTTLDPEWWSTDEITGYRWEERFRAARNDDLGFTTYGFIVVQVAKGGTGVAPMLRDEGDASEWVSLLTDHDLIEARDVAEVEVGGKPATSMWIDLPEGASDSDAGGSCFVPCVTLFQAPGYGWYVGEGFPQRVWVIDMDEGSIIVFGEALHHDHEGWGATLDEWITTIEWLE